MTESTPPRCSFCGKTQDEVQTLVVGDSATICDGCLDLCRDIIGDEPARRVTERPVVTERSAVRERLKEVAEQRIRRELAGLGWTPICSFCGKSQDEVRKLIAGPRVYICEECVARFSD